MVFTRLQEAKEDGEAEKKKQRSDVNNRARMVALDTGVIMKMRCGVALACIFFFFSVNA